MHAISVYKKNHGPHTCKAKLKCCYCHQAGKKNIDHNAALCAQLDNKEFANIICTESTKNEAKTCHSKEDNNSINRDIFGKDSVTVEDRVFATYDEFMKFICSSEQYDDDWDTDANKGNCKRTQVYSTKTEASSKQNRSKI